MIVGIDVGGTFTDMVFFDGRRLYYEKIPSNPHAPHEAVREGITLLGDRKIDCLIHGTTVATNAVLEGKGARVALVATKGFKDIVEIGRQTRMSLYDLFVRRPTPLVSRKARFEVSERTDYRGKIITPLAMDDVVERIGKSGCDAVAVCFLHSYANATNERRAGRALKGFHVSLSSEVLNEFREYERFSTTLLDAYTSPIMGHYLSSLTYPFDIYVMQSNGGVLSAHEASRKSVVTLLSGPAAGVKGATHFSKLSGFSNLLSFDMGGTSTDVCLIQDGKASSSREHMVAGHPCSLPMCDIHTVGAGGGSIAWIDSGGALHVGPQSAGASPGPACYGVGSQPTVTDADLMLGYLNPSYFLGGKMRLKKNKAENTLTRLARKLRVNTREVAWGIFSIVNSNMVSALKVISVQKGIDPVDFALFAFGGAGPVHGAFLASELGVKCMLIPHMPGAFSAFGLLTADRERDYSCTNVMPLFALDDRLAAEIFESMEKEKGYYERSCELRFKGQSHEIEIPFSGKKTLKKKFCEAHLRLFGYSTEDEVEIVNFRTKRIDKTVKPKMEKIGRGNAAKALKGIRDAFFGEKFMPCRIYERSLLGAGSKIAGPAIVEEGTSTTVIPPRCGVHVDAYGTLVMEVHG